MGDLSDAVDEAILATDEGGWDPLRERIDLIIRKLAEWRDEIAALPPEDYLRRRELLRHHSLCAALDAGDSKAAAAFVDADGMAQLLRKMRLRERVDRVTGAVWPMRQELSHVEMRMQVEDVIKNAGFRLHKARGHVTDPALESSTAVAQQLASDVRRHIDPLVGDRMLASVEDLARVLEGMKPGRPARGQAKVSTEEALSNYLSQIGLEGSVNTRRAARKRRRKK